jgi:hypothetical protein
MKLSASTPVPSVPGLVVIADGIGPDTCEKVFAHYTSEAVQWFARFRRFPKHAKLNGHHTMLLDPKHAAVLQPAVQEAIASALKVCSHPMLKKMQRNEEEVAVAGMKHEPNWGLGAHVDSFAPRGEGLVVMITVANTKTTHRLFRFTQPMTARYHDVSTPSGTVVVFTHEAYEEWMHESCRNPRQDGTCISLTVRLRQIDGYNGWAVPQSIKDEAQARDILPKRYRSHAYALEQMDRRIKQRHNGTPVPGDD